MLQFERLPIILSLSLLFPSPSLHFHFRWKFYSSFASLIPESLEKNDWLNFLQTQWNKQFLENRSEFSSERVGRFEGLYKKSVSPTWDIIALEILHLA